MSVKKSAVPAADIVAKPHATGELPAASVDRDACGFETKTVDHPPLFTVDDSQKLRSEIEGGHTKNLFLKDKKGNYFLLTAQEDS